MGTFSRAIERNKTENFRVKVNLIVVIVALTLFFLMGGAPIYGLHRWIDYFSDFNDM